jgi:hypothetical protein
MVDAIPLNRAVRVIEGHGGGSDFDEYGPEENRYRALLAALEGTHANMHHAAVVERAKAFEEYLATGDLKKEPDNSVNGQLTRAFVDLTGSGAV